MNDTRTPAAAPALVLRRVYAAPRQRVFDAWTKPELAIQFLGTGDVTVPEARMDVRTGGSYTIVMQMPDGERWNVGGVYREVRPPERLSMTWRWEEDKPEDEYDTLLTLEFNEVDGGTELVLTHEQFASADSRDRHQEGWTAIMAQADAVIAGPQARSSQ
ncbi:MAG TPA: SRPBCC domain-containing protein [Candidatus Tumulicola sp.]|nr:SRPBCC domain-containing protein [Candidatus Tumulicola sp.]